MRKWRRLHDDEIVSAVDPVEALGMWEPSAWRVAAPSEIAQSGWVEMLVDAHARADALAREAFGHTCTVTCAQWLPEERRRQRR
jgi:hypothetical protein